MNKPNPLLLIAVLLVGLNSAGVNIPVVSDFLATIQQRVAPGQVIATKIPGVQLLVVLDSQATMPQSQQSLLDGKQMAEWVQAHCSKTGDSVDFRKIDKDEKPDGLAPVFRDLWALKRDSLPWLYAASNGRVPVSEPLPVSWEAAQPKLAKVSK